MIRDQEHQSAPNSDMAQALGQAMQSAANLSRSSKSEVGQSNSTAAVVRNLWQHPFVDVFKHFRLMPVQDWKQNKKQGDVSEFFAKEIGRKAVHIAGTISANNFIQMPHPNSMLNSLSLTGRYLYLQVKAPVSSTPFSFHIDLQMAERTHGVRISSSNLYKKVSTQNGFVMQVPLNLDINRWTVVVFDLYELLKHSRLLPSSYLIEGSYQIKGLTLCSNSQIRGVYTSDNLYDFVTLPPDMRFKFQFEISRWPEYFAWLELPNDLDERKNEKRLAEERIEQARAKAALKAQNQGQHMTNDQRRQMQLEIDQLLTHQKLQNGGGKYDVDNENDKQARYEAIQNEMAAMLGTKSGHGGDDLLSPDEKLGFGFYTEKQFDQSGRDGLNIRSLPQGNTGGAYHAGQFIGEQIKRSQKLNQDPIMELKHIIGYSPSACLNLKWSKLPYENIVVFSSAGVLITMDVETRQQKKFFFGHSAPICCFDIAAHGNMLASAQEGKNSIIRIWDYHTARCLSMLPMPVVTMKCISFSPDGRFLASVGKDSHNKELIVVWDISRIQRNEKPDILARQTSDFNILCLKFSPVDNYRLVSCGKENIRFWRIKETANIRGSAVVLNQHARNTVFTSLDFEHGARAAITPSNSSQNGDSKENDALKRVYVASKHGMVFQINYATEQLEATYRTNDSSIYTIAVNEAFCVTGSEDNYLRVWPLDFSELLMEAKHEGTVCSVDISADGLRVVCGTLNGSLGVIDKSNTRYSTLIRSHTDQILSMDFHLALRNIITVSLDGTIRLWDLQNFDQVIEFTSPLEQPLCVAGHPTLPLFSCGFQTGTMRVFDIEKTCVADEFTQFNKPIRALCYSPKGELLVTCCEDGSIAIHNAFRQHLPIKMFHLDFTPQFVHVAFSQEIVRRKITQIQQNNHESHIQLDDQSSQMDQSENYEAMESENQSEKNGTHIVQDFSESLFAVMGEYGNSVSIYSSESLIVKHQIQIGTVVRSFQFNKKGREFIVVTKDQRIRFYSLTRYEGTYIRELCTVHRGAVRTTDISKNGGFMLTGGEDNLLKIWDYDAQKTTPTHFQAFIGHTYPVFSTIFNPYDNNMIFSAGENDGIFIWQFHGDTKAQYNTQEDEEIQQTGFTTQYDLERIHEPTVLEQMRAKVQEKRKPKLAEFSFLLKEFKLLTVDDPLKFPEEPILDVFEEYYKDKRREEQLTFNHFVSLKQKWDEKHHNYNYNSDIDVKSSQSDFDDMKLIDSHIVNGYDGFGGVHDNLIWNPIQGNIIYTLNNKVIIEQTKTREQTVLALSSVRLSCLAQSSNGKLLAVAEGEPNEQEQCFIYLIDLNEKTKKKTLVFHQKGIQSIAFGFQDKIIISVGVKESNLLVLHSVEHGNAIRAESCGIHPTNKIVIYSQPRTEQTEIRWVTLGNKGNLIRWKVDFGCNDPDDEIRENFPNTDFEIQPVEMPNDELAETDFLTAAYFKDTILIGCNEGRVAEFNDDLHKSRHNDDVKLKVLIKKKSNQITQVSVRTGLVVIGTSDGQIYSYAPQNNTLLPPDDMEKITITDLKGGVITAFSMDEKNEEGMVGASQGKIFYVCLKEAKEKKQEKVETFHDNKVVCLVNKVSASLENIDIVRVDPANSKVFMTNCGDQRGEVKLFSSFTLDTVFTFINYQLLGQVRFIASSKDKKNNTQRMIGYAKGSLRIISIDTLSNAGFYKIDLDDDEELTCGAYSANGLNWAIGTNFGNVILGGSQRDLFKKYIGFKTTKIEGLMKDQQHGVTSVQLSQFTPDGQMLVAFDNGEVKLWKSYIPEERLQKLKQLQEQERKSKKKQSLYSRDIADIGILKFDIMDTFDMFKNHQQFTKEIEDDDGMSNDHFRGKRYTDCSAQFDPSGSSSNEIYYCFVGALQHIFVYNFEHRQVIYKIPLLHFPTKMQLLNCDRLLKLSEQPLPFVENLDTLVCVGTKEGKVLVYVSKIQKHQYKCLLQTKEGTMFGEVRGLSAQEDQNFMVASSSSGEVASFNLIKSFEQ